MSKYTVEEFIQKAKAIHGDKYDYSKIQPFDKMSEKLCIICPTHGEFWQEAHGHLRGYGCLKCYYDSLKQSSRSNTQKFIERARKKHGDFFDYSKVDYKTRNDPVCIICPKHGEFWQTPGNHLLARGCLECKKESAHNKYSLGKDNFIKKARKIHGDKYDYSKVDYYNNHSKITIICPEHGEFVQTANEHLVGRGCPICGKEKSKKKKHTTEQFIAKAKKVHGDRYDYSKTQYKGYYEKVCITCPKHGDFWQTPARHLGGNRCPNCQSSRGEEKIVLFCQEHDIDYQCQFAVDIKDVDKTHRLLYDFYIPKYNLLIEYQGEPHYRFIKHFHKTQEKFKYRQHMDFLKFQYALENGYNFIPIPYWDLDRLDMILSEILLDDPTDDLIEKYSDWT